MISTSGANTYCMHIAGVIGSIAVFIYTLSWAWTLWKGGNREGALWTCILALASTGTALYYFWQHGFLP